MTQKTIQSQKSNLAKLLATENITVLQNQVQTASFDVKDRVLTIPFFKHNDNNVVDMLIAHEVSHALHTPAKGWEKMANRSKDFRSFVNVLEDTTIDKLIQKKYPGVISNYIKGFKKLEEDNFFKTKDKDINDYALIDRINLWYKSSKTLNVNFSSKEKHFINAVENLKSFDDVTKLAEEILGYCKEELKKDKKKQETYKIMPESDTHKDVEDSEKSDSSASSSSDKLEQWLDQKEKSSKPEEKEDVDKDKLESTGKSANGAGGDVKIRSITDELFNSPKLKDESKKHRLYGTLPKPILKHLIVPYKKFIADQVVHYNSVTKDDSMYREGLKKCEQHFIKFKNSSNPIVNYLVKEFEMRKSARLNARQKNDKTGIIDPLKLHSYKYAEDIFKKISIVPNEKNHGMIFLLDWSGSMGDSIHETVEQLLNLVWFVKKINIPFSVYAFMNNDHYNEKNESNMPDSFTKDNGQLDVDKKTRLVQLFATKMTKLDMLNSAKYLYVMSSYWSQRRRSWSHGFDNDYYVPSPHRDYYLCSTPLDESLIAMDTIIPMFQNTYKVDKTIFVSLTDGGSNGCNNIVGSKEYGDLWIKIGKDYRSISYRSESFTNTLLKYLKKKYSITTVGFYLVKKFRRLEYQLWDYSEEQKDKMRKDFLKNKFVANKKSGYDVYYYIKSDTKVEDANLDKITDESSKADIKRAFSKGMKSRLQSRVVLQNFIKEVA